MICFYNHCDLTLEDVEKKWFVCIVFRKNDLLPENFQNSVPKVFIVTLIDVLCSNFVKSGWWESVKSCIAYLTKKKQNFAWLSRSCYSADRTQNLLGPAPNSVLILIQISSRSVHLRRSYWYIRTCEHRQSALENEPNIWLKPGFEPNNYFNFFTF